MNFYHKPVIRTAQDGILVDVTFAQPGIDIGFPVYVTERLVREYDLTMDMAGDIVASLLVASARQIADKGQTDVVFSFEAYIDRQTPAEESTPVTLKACCSVLDGSRNVVIVKLPCESDGA